MSRFFPDIFMEVDSIKEKVSSLIEGAISSYAEDKRITHREFMDDRTYRNKTIDSNTHCKILHHRGDDVIEVTKIKKSKKIMYRIESEYLETSPIFVSADMSLGW